MVASLTVNPTALEGQSITSLIWGNTPEIVSQDFDVPGAAASFFPGETGYGMPGDNYHSGLDIGMPVGTTLHSPVNGHVVCAGTDDGPGVNGQGCGAYQSDTGGLTSGRVEIEYGNHQSVIFGHSSETLIPIGAAVSVGQAVAKSGAAGSGAHLHLEERQPSALTASGYQIVSPVDLINGTAASGSAGRSGGGLDLSSLSGAVKRTGLFIIGGALLVLGVMQMRKGGGSSDHPVRKALTKAAAL